MKDDDAPAYDKIGGDVEKEKSAKGTKSTEQLPHKSLANLMVELWMVNNFSNLRPVSHGVHTSETRKFWIFAETPQAVSVSQL